MIRISNLKLPPDGTASQLLPKAAQALGVTPGAIQSLTLSRQSIDARDRGEVHYVCTVDCTVANEEQVLRHAPGKGLTLVAPASYAFPAVRRSSPLPPVVVGMGPAGLFAALYLARNQIPCILIERGQQVDQRTKDVEAYWRTGLLDPRSNVQFGEGGAGTFSDGKLTTGTKDGRIWAVMDSLVAAGAPEDVRYSHKPHIGTDVLRQVVASIRRELLELGCEIRFGHQLVALEHTGHQLTGVRVDGPAGRYPLPCDALVLAPGHSARDTFQMLYDAGVPMGGKPFAIGVRLEHLQKDISAAQYGPMWEQLPPADYKLACHLPSGRSAFTFCVCPGGQVVAAASAQGEVVTNGMSRRARDAENCNGGLLVGVGPQDFADAHPLAGVRFQQEWEGAAFRQGGSEGRAPAQRTGDFLARRPSQGPGKVAPSYRPGVTWGAVDGCLPGYVSETLRQALPLLDRKVRGFATPDGVLTGVETRSSSPVRILRDDSCQSALRGLYPCGEGAGYAGGIVSAAVDGIRVAEMIAEARA